jgi:hypothetical protein
MSNVRALQGPVPFRACEASRTHESTASRPSSGVRCRRCVQSGSLEFRVEPSRPPTFVKVARLFRVAPRALRFGHAATSVSGWRFAPPCCAGQSVSGLGALPGSGQFTSFSKRVGRAPWQSRPSSNIARALQSNYAGQSSVVMGALPDSEQLTSSSKGVGRVCWQSCASSSIALTLPSNGQSQAGFAHL